MSPLLAQMMKLLRKEKAYYADDFNRPNELLEASPNWSRQGFYSSISVENNATNGVYGGVYRWTNPVSPNQWCEAETNPNYPTSHGAWCAVRIPSSGYGGYIAGVYINGQFRIGVMAADSTMTWYIVATTTVPPYTCRIEAEGSTIRGYFNGVLKLTITDTMWPIGGIGTGWSIGAIAGNPIRIDNWRGGDL